MGFWRDFLSESWRDRIAGQRPAPWLRGGGRSLACHFILTTFPKEILRKIQNFLRLVNKENILCSIELIGIFYPSCRYLYTQLNILYVLPIKPSEPAKKSHMRDKVSKQFIGSIFFLMETYTSSSSRIHNEAYKSSYNTTEVLQLQEILFRWLL